MSLIFTKNIYYKVLTIIITLALVLYLFLKFALSPILTSFITKVVQEQTNQKLIIGDISLQLLDLGVKLENINLNDQKLIENVTIELSLGKILENELVISEIDISKVDFNIVKENNRFALQGINPISSNINKDVKNEGKQQQINKWIFTVKKINVNNSKVGFVGGPTLKISNIQLTGITTSKKKSTITFTGKTQLNNAPLDFSGFVKNYLNSPSAEMSLSTQSLNLSNLNYFIDSSLGPVRGSLSLKTKLDYNTKRLFIDSSTELEDFKLLSNDLKTINYFTPYMRILKSRLKIEAKNKMNHSPLYFKADEVFFKAFLMSIPNKKIEREYYQASNILLQNISFSQALQDNIFLKTNINGSGRVQVKETQNKQINKLSVDIKKMDLKPFSDSFESVLGYQVETGKLNLTLDLKTDSTNKKKGNVSVILNQFKVDSKNEKGLSIEKKTKLPLRSAISLIKDDKGNIEIDLNLKGKDKNISFGFLPMLKAGLGSIMLSRLSSMIATKAATQFLPLLVSTIPFSPTNALVLINGGYKFLTKPRFSNIEFIYGSDLISKGSLETIEKLKIFLNKKKNFNFTLCPIANSFEIETLDHKKRQVHTLELADKRISQVREILSQKPSVMSQVIFCRPQIKDFKSHQGIMNISF